VIHVGNAIAVKKEFQIDLEGGLFLKGEVTLVEDGIAKPVLLISHGFRGSKDWGFWPYVASWFAERGFYVVHFDFSRVGALNRGADEITIQRLSTVSRELSDLEAILEHLNGSKLPLFEQAETDRIALLGHSRAGGSSIIFAAEHSHIGAVVAWNGGPRPSAAPGNPNPFIAEDLEQNNQRFDTSILLASLTAPALVIQGGSDREALIESQRNLSKAAPNQTYVTIPDADHSFGGEHPFLHTTPYLEEALEITNTFLKKSY
jgi:pimeloyl-ACP methyl ester carboxylesterase